MGKPITSLRAKLITEAVTAFLSIHGEAPERLEIEMVSVRGKIVTRMALEVESDEIKAVYTATDKQPE